MTKEF